MKRNSLSNNIRQSFQKQLIGFVTIVVCLLFCGVNVEAQNTNTGFEITGTVTDAGTKMPLNGARIMVADHPNLAVITDEEGNYKIKVPASWMVLVVTALDYSEREVAIQGKNRIDIELYSDMFSSYYGNVEAVAGGKRNTQLTSPTVTMSGFDKSPAISLDSEIQSQLGGNVRAITRSGTPGMGSAMFIRGLNSLNASAQPLIVVDGIIWDTQLNNSSIHMGFFSNVLANIGTHDIESVTVIKDGNSLYGSKGANGVILINTARGKDMVTTISANMAWGAHLKPSLPPMMNASEYRTYASNQVQGILDYYSNSMTNSLENAFPFLGTDPTANNYKVYNNETDWSDEVYTNGLFQSYSVAVNGGDDVALYNLSVSYMDTDGTIENTSMDRITARFNSDISLSSKMFTKVDVSIAKTSRELRDDGINEYSTPGFLSLIKAPLLSTHKVILSTGEKSPKLSDYDTMDPTKPLSNPIALIDNAVGKASRTGFNLRINPYFMLKDELKLEAIFSYRLDRVKESFFIPIYGIAPQVMTDGSSVSNEVRDLAQRQIALSGDLRVDWKHELDMNNHISVLGGVRYMSDDYESDLPRGYNTGNDNIKILVSGLSNKSVVGVNNNWKSISWYANAVYDYQNKYILGLTASADASSRFGKKAKNGFELFDTAWGVFPSAEAGWVVSSEEFMKNAPVINFLKLRASYGITGNDDIEAYAANDYFRPINFMSRATGVELANIRNDELQWETSRKVNVGLDAHLLNERVSLSFDAYMSKTDNLLTQKLLNPIAGLYYYWANEGKLENKGFEASLTGKLVDYKNFKWQLGASAGHYKNKITALPDGDYITEIADGTILTAIGQPLGVFYGYKTKGIFSTTAEAEASGLYKLNANGSRSYYGAGDVHFVDLDGNKAITEADRQIIGDPNPDFFGTISNHFQYKRFGLDVMFTYSYGNDVYNYQRSLLESGATFYNQTTAMLNRWTTEGQVTNMPKATYGDPIGNNSFSDRWIEDGSYLRLKSLTFSYQVPLKSTYVHGFTVWASATNLWTLTDYLGSDPEFSSSNSPLYQGIDMGQTPQSTSIYLGVKFNL